jgi:hypothetical protein
LVSTYDVANTLPSDEIFINVRPGESRLVTHETVSGRVVTPSIQCVSVIDDVLSSGMMYYDPLNITNSAFQFTTDSGTFYNNNTNVSNGVWYALEASEQVLVTHFGVIDSHDNTDLFARSFAFETSDDGQTWTRRYTQTEHVHTNTLVAIRLEEPVTARYFRYYCIQGADQLFWELSRLLLFDMNTQPMTYKPVMNELSVTSISDTESELTNNSTDTYYIVKIELE